MSHITNTPKDRCAQCGGEFRVGLAPLDPIETLIDSEEIARRLGCSTTFLRRLIDDGRFPPPIRVGRLKRWRVRDFNQWVETRARESFETRSIGKRRRVPA